MPRRPMCLELGARLRFLGEAAGALHADDIDTRRVLRFDDEWSMTSDGELPPTHWAAEPRVVGESDGVAVLHVPGHHVRRGAQTVTPARIWFGLGEEDFAVGEDAAGVFRLTDGARLGPPAGELWTEATCAGFVTTSKNEPLVLIPFDGGPPVRRDDLRPFALATSGGLLHVATGKDVHLLDGTTLVTRRVLSFPSIVRGVRASRGVLLVQTDELLYVVDDAKAPRDVVPSGAGRWVVARHGRWVCHDGDTAYVGERGRPPALVRFTETVRAVQVLEGGLLLVAESRWSFVPTPLPAPGDVELPRLRLELAPPWVLPGKIVFAGSTILRVEVHGPAEGPSRTATVASKGNREGFVAGQAVTVACLELNDLRPTLAVKEVFPEGSRARVEDRLIPLEPRVVLRVGRGEPPAWLALLVEHGFVGSAKDVPAHLWHLRPHEALAAIHGARRGLRRGFLCFDHRFANDTKDAAKDLLRLAKAEGVTMASRVRDGTMTVTTKSTGEERKTSIDVEGGGLYPLVALVNAELARVSAPRRVYDVETGSDQYVFVACLPEDVAEFEAVGFGRMSDDDEDYGELSDDEDLSDEGDE